MIETTGEKYKYERTILKQILNDIQIKFHNNKIWKTNKRYPYFLIDCCPEADSRAQPRSLAVSDESFSYKYSA